MFHIKYNHLWRLFRLETVLKTDKRPDKTSHIFSFRAINKSLYIPSIYNIIQLRTLTLFINFKSIDRS